jgi:MYXO-CTERM domain-containing protein
VSAARAAAALAALLVAAPGVAYERTIARGTGEPLAWPFPVVPWHLNRAWPSTAPSCEPAGAADPALDAVRASFAAWEQPCSDLQLLYAGTLDEIGVGMVGSRANLVVFRAGWCSNHPQAMDDPCMDDPDVDCGGIYNCFEDHGDRGVVALTSVLYDPGTGRIVDADIEVNGWDGTVTAFSPSAPEHGWYFTCSGLAARECTSYGEDDCHYIDLANTVTHEVGHFIGLRHPCGEPGLPSCSSGLPSSAVPWEERTMFPNTDAGDVAKVSLSEDDVDGVCAIYPSDGGGCGCGSGGAGGAGLLLLGALALRRRRGARVH